MAQICIDAGHGGNDVGASKGGRYERDDVLKMASAAEETRAVCSRIGGKSENREYDVTGKEVTI